MSDSLKGKMRRALRAYLTHLTDLPFVHKNTDRPWRSVPHFRRRHERRLNFSLLQLPVIQLSIIFQIRQPPAAIGSSPTASRTAAKIFNYQSCNRRKVGACGNEALVNARQKSLLTNNAARFFARPLVARASRPCVPSCTGETPAPLCLPKIIFIRSLPPAPTAATPIPGCEWLLPI